MRSWLVRGSRRFAVDPRRRFGRNGGARRLLANETETAPVRHGAWGGLVSALQRHTVHGELSQLSKEDRQILSMAYLYGHTNREIAQMLDVSVSTVRRRLSVALSRLDESMRRAGLWISAFALGALALYNRLNHSARGTRLAATLAAVAAGTATVATLGIVAVSPGVANGGATTERHMGPPAAVFGRVGEPAGHVTSTTIVTRTTGTTDPKHGSTTKRTSDADARGDAQSAACAGNPTSAPPDVPVASRGDHPTGAPVTHPGPGGCAPAS
jgi:hypothetical protein